MSGGGKGAKAPDNNVEARIPPWRMNMTPQTMPAFGPGQQQMLANQLAMGGFGTAPAYMKYLDEIYSPATVLSDGPLPKTPTVPTTKTPTDKKPTTPTKWNWNGGRNNR